MGIMKKVKKKLKSVKDIRREKSMSCSNLSSRSYPPRTIHSTISTSNIAEDENEDDANHSSSSTVKHADLSSIVSFLKDNNQSMATCIDAVMEKEIQSTSPISSCSQDNDSSAAVRVGTNVLVRKWSKRKSDNAVRIFPIEENENVEVIYNKPSERANEGSIEETQIEYVEGTNDDTNLVEKDAEDIYNGFRKMPTILVALLLIIHSLVMITLIFLLPIICEQRSKPHGPNSTQVSDGPTQFAKCYVDSFSLLIYCHSLYWLAHLIWDQYLKKKHKENRISGYLDFYLDTKNIRRAPFYIVSTCNFLLLLVMTLLHDYDDYLQYYYDNFRKVDWIRGLITIECIAIICLITFYIRKVCKFNRQKMPPDVMCDSYMERLRANLAWEWDSSIKKDKSGENTPEDVKEWDRKVKESLTKHQQIVSQKINLPNQYISILQAGLINFLIQQIRQKNKKLVSLIQQISELANIVECDVEVGNQVIVC